MSKLPMVTTVSAEWVADIQTRLTVALELLGRLRRACDSPDWDYEWSNGEHDDLLVRIDAITSVSSNRADES